MPEQIIDIPGVGVTAFPESMTPEQVSAAAKKLYDDAQPKPMTGTPTVAQVGQTAAVAVPAMRAGLEELATNPNAWKTGKLIGEAVGAVTGWQKGGPIGAAGGMWVGGRAGWRVTNALQRVAGPLIKALNAVEPFTLGTSALASEADALSALNSPATVADFAKKLNPIGRQRLVAYYDKINQPEMVKAITNAVGPVKKASKL
jgi:hypothetical protein